MVEFRPLKDAEATRGPQGVGGAGTAEPSRARRVWEVPSENTGKTEKTPPRSLFGEMKEGAEMDHVWTFEARISWDDFMCVILYLERGQLRGV